MAVPVLVTALRLSSPVLTPLFSFSTTHAAYSPAHRYLRAVCRTLKNLIQQYKTDDTESSKSNWRFEKKRMVRCEQRLKNSKQKKVYLSSRQKDLLKRSLSSCLSLPKIWALVRTFLLELLNISPNLPMPLTCLKVTHILKKAYVFLCRKSSHSQEINTLRPRTSYSLPRLNQNLKSMFPRKVTFTSLLQVAGTFAP